MYWNKFIFFYIGKLFVKSYVDDSEWEIMFLKFSISLEDIIIGLVMFDILFFGGMILER